MVYPDPSDPLVAENHRKGIGQVFERLGQLPFWDEDFLVQRVAELRKLERRGFASKSVPSIPDLLRILKAASQAGVDMVTFDGGGGGSGSSPPR